MTIHVPATGGQSDPSRGWLAASQIGPHGSNYTGVTTYPVLDEPAGVLTGVVEETSKGFKAATNLLLQDLDADIHTSVTLSPANPEDRVHIAALINAVATQQTELKQAFKVDLFVYETTPARD